MVRVKNVEAYLVYECVVWLEVFLNQVMGRNDNPYELEQQWSQLKRAFHLFMLDLEADEFKQMHGSKEVELPSEQREKESEKAEEKNKVKAGARNVGKQLQLFFVNCKEVVVLTEKKLFRKLELRLLGNDRDYKTME